MRDDRGAVNTRANKTGPYLDDLAFVEIARDRLRHALAELPARSRHAFLLHRLEGLSTRRIAAQLGVPISVVENEITGVIEHLTRSLFEREDPP